MAMKNIDFDLSKKIPSVQSYCSFHNHTIFSNTRFLDAIATPYYLILNAFRKGLKGIAFTDHQSLVGCFMVTFAIKRLKKQYPHMFDHFKVIFGDEIYLNKSQADDKKAVKKEQQYFKDVKANPDKQIDYPYHHFFHCILIALNEKGFEILEKLNALAWEHSFKFGRYDNRQTRVPNYKDEVAKAMKGHKGDVAISTACLGSELAFDHQVISRGVNPKFNAEWQKKQKEQIKKAKADIPSHIKYMEKVFGKDNTYLEVMPSLKKQQTSYNSFLAKLSKKTGLKTLVTTDSHYIDSRDEHSHHFLLNMESKGKRDVYDFYHYAHTFSYAQMAKPTFFGGHLIDPKLLKQSAKNSLELMNKVQPIDMKVVIKNRTAKEDKVQKMNFKDALKVTNKYLKKAGYMAKKIEKGDKLIAQGVLNNEPNHLKK